MLAGMTDRVILMWNHSDWVQNVNFYIQNPIFIVLYIYDECNKLTCYYNVKFSLTDNTMHGHVVWSSPTDLDSLVLVELFPISVILLWWYPWVRYLIYLSPLWLISDYWVIIVGPYWRLNYGPILSGILSRQYEWNLMMMWCAPFISDYCIYA